MLGVLARVNDQVKTYLEVFAAEVECCVGGGGKEDGGKECQGCKVFHRRGMLLLCDRVSVELSGSVR